jgi:hypothetical protein
MAIREDAAEFLTSGQAPIAGQSLTNDPESPLPFEKAPKFADVHEAAEFLWTKLIDEQTYVTMMRGLADGVPVMEVVQLILTQGFDKGLWNPDMMLMLIEPTAYMIIALAERLDIPLVVYAQELLDDGEEEKVLGVAYEEEKIREMMEASETGRVPQGIVSPAMMQEVEAAALPDKESILADSTPQEVEAPAQEETAPAPEEAPQDSLMARPQVEG